ncbi:MAG: OmpA family protein, partial [Synechococcaceae cyanobacterium RM1_1_27]|nr:OmpA family protein [Synechococcaceae cyanobacterium RM1_1_27]
ESITLEVGTQTISLPGDVLFDFDQADLRPEATSLLQRVANRLTEQPAARVLVVGHTDDVGEDNYNLVLSLDRANAVKDFLRDALPNADQFNWSSSGYGAAQPVASNDTEVGRQRNRRVDIIIAP